MSDNWIVTFTKPNGSKVVVDQHTTNAGSAVTGLISAWTATMPEDA